MSKQLKTSIALINANLGKLRSEYNIKSIAIFGSLAKGKQRKNSDVDIVVEFYEPIGFFKFMELEFFLTKLLKKKVDLVTKKALKPIIKQDILKSAVYV